VNTDVYVKTTNNKFNKNQFLIELNKLISTKITLFRPKDIPPIVPDCGWNHGEPKK